MQSEKCKVQSAKCKMQNGGGNPRVYRANHFALCTLHFALCTLLPGCLLAFLLAAGASTPASAQPPSQPNSQDPAPATKPARPPGTSIYANTEGKARVTLFGLTGKGYKFVYVLDRSASMAGSGHEALRILKAELIQSLGGLDEVHQFQIVFYNDKPMVFNPSGATDRLAFATDENKSRAERFIRSITADGGTRHEDALKLAIRLHPDVIFFLTDGDDPKLSPAQLDQISRQAGGITIHAIELGSGKKPAGKTFLETLAAENGGKYAYVDILGYASGSEK